MEGRIGGEIAHTAAGMNLSTANEIVNELLKKYESVQTEKKGASGQKISRVL